MLAAAPSMASTASATATATASASASASAIGLALGLILAAATASSTAQGATAAELFKDADMALGSRLLAEHQRQACHVRKVGGDGSAIYRPQGRINTPAYLRGRVEQCNSELKTSLFPEEVTAIAAVLNRDHYQFK